MTKTRIYEYARQNNISSKAVRGHLKEMKIDVSNHMANISDDTKKKLDEKINPTQKQEKAKKNKQNSQKSSPEKQTDNKQHGKKQGQGQTDKQTANKKASDGKKPQNQRN